MWKRDRKVLVLGLGDTGLSMARWLARHGARVARRRHARRAAARGERSRASCPHVPLATGAFDETLFSGVDAIAISPGIDAASRPSPTRSRAACRSSATSSSSRRRCRTLARKRSTRRAEGARDHRHQRQEHGHRDGGRVVPRGRARDASSPATSACRCSTRSPRSRTARRCPRCSCSSFRASSSRAPSTPRRRRGDGAQRHRGPPRPLRRHRRLRGGEGAHLRRRRRAGAESRRRAGAWAWRVPGRTVVTFGSTRRRGERDWGIADDARCSCAATRALMPVERAAGRGPAQRRERARRACAGARDRAADAARCSTACARFRGPAAPAARTSPRCAACASTTIRKARTSARPSRRSTA